MMLNLHESIGTGGRGYVCNFVNVILAHDRIQVKAIMMDVAFSQLK